MKVPNTTKLEKYARKRFKSKRLKKKQIVRLKQSYLKLCKKYNIIGMHLTVTGEIDPREEYGCRIAILRQGLETMSRIDEIPVAKPLSKEQE